MKAPLASRTRILAGIAALGATLVAPAPAQAQGDAGVATGPTLEVYRFGDAGAAGLESVTLVTQLFAARYTRGSFSAELSGGWARGTVERPDLDRVELTGLSDTHLRVDWAPLPDQLTLTIRGTLPTGAASLSSEESVVASVLSADLLPFRLRNWGTGGGLFLEGVASRTFGNVAAGLGLGWGTAGDFEPLSDDAAVYRPASQLSARVALEAPLGRGARVSLRLGVRHFAEDRLDGRNLFRPGTRAEGLGSVGFPTPRGGSASIYVGWIRREEGAALLENLSDAPAQDLLLLGGLWRLALGRSWVQPRADLRLFRSADGIGQGYHASVGASAEFDPHPRVTLLPSLQARFGRVDVREGLATGFQGMEVGLTLRFGR